MRDAANPPLLVFSDDWQRHPSSCQHLIRHLLPRYDVCWVNTIGMRTPGLDLNTLTRGAGKLWSWARRPASQRAPDSNPRVCSPLMWPSFRGFGRAVNRRLLAGQLQSVVAAMDAPPIAITTVPITADLIGAIPAAHWVYYCVDDFSQWPGLDHATLAAMERTLVQGCDRIIAVSETLCQRLGKMGRTAELLTHGVDLEHWQAANSTTASLPELADFERPLVVFWGLIDRRLDVSFVRSTAASMASGTLLLVGPQLDADPDLWQIPRVRHVPALAYDRLPRLATEASLLVMPYADLPVTRAMQPLKLKEYLATGKPVVVRQLPAIEEWSDCLDAAATAEEFAALVSSRLKAGIPNAQWEGRRRLAGESWQAKARQFEEWAILSGAEAVAHHA